MNRRSLYLLVCVLVQLVFQCRTELPPPEILARMEDKVMSSMALKSLEQLVENDKSIKDVKSRLLSKIPEHMLGGRVVIESDGEAYYDPTPIASERLSDASEPRKSSEDNKDKDPIERFIVIESAEGDDDDAKSGTGASKLTPEESRAVQHFVEVLAEEIATELPAIKKPSRMDMDSAASESSRSYKPRFDYDSYSRDPPATKFGGKRYWRDSDHSEDPDARSDGKGCTMVVKKFRDPEDHGNSKDGSPVKSVLVTKECVYPDGRGPDAMIPVASGHSRQPLHGYREKPKVRVVSYEEQSLPVYSENLRAPDPPIYSSTPERKRYGRDPLKSDYIDSMLDEHFKGFPNFRTTSTAVEELEHKLKTGLKDVKSRDASEEQPDYSYERKSPPPPKVEKTFKSDDGTIVKIERNPKVYQHHYNYHHGDPNSREEHDVSSSSEAEPPSHREPDGHHHHHHGPRDQYRQYDTKRDYSDEGRHSTEGTSKPKMLKKSFAYYRKDNPKNDPNNHQYAEEYAQGNYRSFSSDYDSDRDGPERST